jgi:hypothetical protein
MQQIETAVAWFGAHKGLLLLMSLPIGAWIWMFYIMNNIFPRLLGTNYTQVQVDAYHDLITAPLVMFVGGLALGWVCGTGYAAEQTKKVKSPG